MDHINDKLKSRIARQLMTVTDLVGASGVSQATVYQLLNGGDCKPVTAYKLAKALNCEPWEIGLMEKETDNG